MRRKPGITSVFLLIGLLLFPSIAPGMVTQTAPPPPQQTAPPPPPTPQQLDQLLAPIALSRPVARADYHGLHQPTGSSRRHQLARAEPEPHRRRSHRRRAKTGVRSGLPRARRLPHRASDDGGPHRRLRRHWPGDVGQPGRGGCIHPAPAQSSLCRRGPPHQPTAEG